MRRRPLVAASMIPVTQRLKFSVALRPSVVSRPLPHVRRQRSTGSPTDARCLTRSPAAIRRNWPVTACSSIIRNAARPPPSLPASGDVCLRGNGHLRWQAYSCSRRETLLSSGTAAASTALLRRIVGCGTGSGGRTGRSLSDSGSHLNW